MQRSLKILTTVLAAALATTVYVHQPAPRSAIGDAVGVRRSRSFNGFCGWFVRDTRFVTYPTGEAVCAWYRPEGAERRAELDQLNYHALTRRVRHAARSWEPLTERAWRHDVDSVRTALQAQGGVPACESQTRRTPVEVREYWRFPGFHVELFTGFNTLRTPGVVPDERRWFLFLHGTPRLLRGCERPAEPV